LGRLLRRALAKLARPLERGFCLPARPALRGRQDLTASRLQSELAARALCLVRQVLQGNQRRIEMRDGLAIGAPLNRLLRRQPEAANRPLEVTTADEVDGELCRPFICPAAVALLQA